MGPGGPPGLQNQPWGGDPVLGEFDSHTLPPVKKGLRVSEAFFLIIGVRPLTYLAEAWNISNSTAVTMSNH